jgi:hypothetical protein
VTLQEGVSLVAHFPLARMALTSLSRCLEKLQSS